MRALYKYIRFQDWWNYIIPPIIGWYFFSAWFFNHPIEKTLLDGMLLLLLASTTAAFGFVLNDLTDKKEDRLKGKENHLSQLPLKSVILLITGLLAAQAILLYLLDPNWLIGIHVLQISLFILYSAPPFRLKNIWWIAPVIDAIYSGTLYYFFAFFIIPVKTGRIFEPKWILILLAWGLCRGFRNILWHLYVDAEADRKASHITLVHQKEITPQRIDLIANILNVLETGIFITLLLFNARLIFLWWVTGVLFIYYIQRRIHKNPELKFTLNNLIFEIYLPIISVIALAISVNLAFLFLLIILVVIFPTIRAWFTALYQKTFGINDRGA